MNEKILAAIKTSLFETLSLPEGTSLGLDSKLKSDLGLDSMSTLSFLMSLEENLDGFIVDPDTLNAEHLETIGSVVDYISSEISK